MKTIFHAVAMATTLALSTLPMAAFAQTDIDPKMLTCTEFNSMSDEVKMGAVVLMQQASNDASVNATAPLDVALDATKRACLANPKVKAIEAMAMK
jgi:hypothetical protein